MWAARGTGKNMFEAKKTGLDVEMLQIAEHDPEVDIIAGEIQLRDQIAHTVADEGHRIEAGKALVGKWTVVAQEIKMTRDGTRSGIFPRAESNPNAKSITSRIPDFTARTGNDGTHDYILAHIFASR